MATRTRKKTRRGKRRNPMQKLKKNATLSEARAKGISDKQIKAGFAGAKAQAGLKASRKAKRSKSRKKTVKRGSVRKKKTTKRRPKKRVTKKKRTASQRAKSRRKSKVKTKAKRKARRKTGGWSAARRAAAKKSGKGRAYTKTKRGKKRARPYRGRTTTVKLYKGRKMAPWRKRKLSKHGYLSARGAANPYRKRKGRRKNPPTIMDTAKTFVSKPFVRAVGGAMLGMSAAVVAPAVIESLSNGRIRQDGPQGLALAWGAGVLSVVAAGFVEHSLRKSKMAKPFIKDLTKNVALGVGVSLGVRALFYFAPRVAEYFKLSPVRTPTIDVRRTMAGLAGYGDWVELRGLGRYGDWMELRGMGMGGGMGAVTSNEALIAGESFARSVSQFEGLGDNRIPYQDIRAPGQMLGMGNADPYAAYPSYPGQYGGGHGYGDWMETIPGSGALAQGSWQPAMETF